MSQNLTVAPGKYVHHKHYPYEVFGLARDARTVDFDPLIAVGLQTAVYSEDFRDRWVFTHLLRVQAEAACADYLCWEVRSHGRRRPTIQGPLVLYRPLYQPWDFEVRPFFLRPLGGQAGFTSPVIRRDSRNRVLDRIPRFERMSPDTKIAHESSSYDRDTCRLCGQPMDSPLPLAS